MRVGLLACVVGCLLGCRDDLTPITTNGAGSSAPELEDAEHADGGAPPMTRAESMAGAADSGQASSCTAESVTLAEVHSGRVRSNIPVALGPLVLASQKFLVSEAKSGSCLWGVFAADPERNGAGSGLLLVSFGAEHREGEACRAGSDGLSDDAAPGDRVEARGFVDAFAPSNCEHVAPARQLRVDASCPLTHVGKGSPPEPALIDIQLADALARGDDEKRLEDWGGALVRLEDVSALQDPEDGDAVFPFGVVRLAETALEVRSRLYYFDLTAGGPKSTQKSPRYSFPALFPRVTGIVLLDYCSWVLAPRDRCVDASGAEGCGQAAGP
jgi:hypothetical protein